VVTGLIGQRLIERRLRETTDRLRSLRSELAIVDEQFDALSGDAEDLGLRALVSETPGADVEYREARLHADAMSRHRDDIVRAMAQLEARQDELLDRLSR
jgi:predicted nuclease with TOPRIM domain